MVTKKVSRAKQPRASRRTNAKLLEDYYQARNRLYNTLPEYIDGRLETPAELWEIHRPNIWYRLQLALPRSNQDELARVCYHLLGLSEVISFFVADNNDNDDEEFRLSLVKKLIETNLELIGEFRSQVAE